MTVARNSSISVEESRRTVPKENNSALPAVLNIQNIFKKLCQLSLLVRNVVGLVRVGGGTGSAYQAFLQDKAGLLHLLR